MATSFLSEHSSEYPLVYRITEIFSKQYSKVIPLYFWKSREGGLMSRACEFKSKIRLFAVYARRPKIMTPGQDKILITLNDVLFQNTKYLSECGIPVFFGVPKISSMIDFSMKCPFSFFRIEPHGNGHRGEEFELDINSCEDSQDLPESIKGPLKDLDILSSIENDSQEMSWSDAVEIINNRRQVENQHGYGDLSFFYNRFISYKPVYFLLVK